MMKFLVNSQAHKSMQILISYTVCVHMCMCVCSYVYVYVYACVFVCVCLVILVFKAFRGVYSGSACQLVPLSNATRASHSQLL